MGESDRSAMTDQSLRPVAGRGSGVRAVPLRERVVANLGMLMMVFAWGAFFPLIERVLATWDVYSVTVARQALGALLLAIGVFAQGHPMPGIRRLPWVRVMLLGGIGVALGSFLTSLAVAFSSGLASAIISTTNPVTSALAAALFYREPLGRRMIGGTIVSVVGGLISVVADRSAGGAHFQGGEVFIVIANVAWTWMSMAAQRWLSGYSQLQITALTIGAGALWLILLLPVVALTGAVALRADLDPVNLEILAFSGAVPIAFANFCWHYGVSRTGIVVAAMYNNLLPAVAVAVTVWLGGSFGWGQLAGGAVILAGVLGTQLLGLRRRP
jgi:drug/metabolite transporter (DMT)-like permease